MYAHVALPLINPAERTRVGFATPLLFFLSDSEIPRDLTLIHFRLLLYTDLELADSEKVHDPSSRVTRAARQKLFGTYVEQCG